MSPREFQDATQVAGAAMDKMGENVEKGFPLNYFFHQGQFLSMRFISSPQEVSLLWPCPALGPLIHMKLSILILAYPAQTGNPKAGSNIVSMKMITMKTGQDLLTRRLSTWGGRGRRSWLEGGGRVNEPRRLAQRHPTRLWQTVHPYNNSTIPKIIRHEWELQ